MYTELIYIERKCVLLAILGEFHRPCNPSGAPVCTKFALAYVLTCKAETCSQVFYNVT